MLTCFFSNADAGEDVSRSETNLPVKKTCLTSDVDTMDVEDLSDNEVDAEEELESMHFFLLAVR